jgi:hypothetical protein
MTSFPGTEGVRLNNGVVILSFDRLYAGAVIKYAHLIFGLFYCWRYLREGAALRPGDDY